MRIPGLTPAVAAVLVLVAGCGGVDSATDAGAHESVLPIPTATGPVGTVATGAPLEATPAEATTAAPTPAQTPTDNPADTPRGRRAFATGLADYCTAFASSEAQAADAYPRPDPASQAKRDHALARADRTTEAQLRRLRPPTGVEADFADFATDVDDITADRADIVRFGGAGVADPGTVASAVEARDAVAARLHAPLCDDRLPRAQAAAVLRTIRDFETTEDSERACGELATPAYLQSQYADHPDPLAECVLSRDTQHQSIYAVPQQVIADSIAGTEGVSATVDVVFDTCGCTSAATVDLRWKDGRWLVDRVTSTDH